MMVHLPTRIQTIGLQVTIDDFPTEPATDTIVWKFIFSPPIKTLATFEIY